MTINYIPNGVCSRNISVTVSDDGIIENVTFTGGCSGNTQGVAKLAAGRPASEIIELLRDTDCNGRGTSCPAQLAIALQNALDE